jgi:hypothetical protein
MALHSKKDFAALCGFSSRELSVYIKRGKVILSGDYVDDSQAINKEFLEKRQSKSEPVPLEKTLRMIKPDPGIPEIPDTGGDADDDEDSGLDDDGSESGYALNKKKLQKQIAKLEVDTRLQELKEEKMRGELIPVDLVKNLFRSHTQAIVTSMKDGIEELLINFSAEARLRGDQVANLRGKMTGVLNNGVDKSVLITQKAMRSIVDQVKVKRDVGEHD